MRGERRGRRIWGSRERRGFRSRLDQKTNGRRLGRISSPLVVRIHPIVVSIHDIGDWHELGVWIINRATVPRPIREAGVNILHCENC